MGFAASVVVVEGIVGTVGAVVVITGAERKPSMSRIPTLPSDTVEETPEVKDRIANNAPPMLTMVRPFTTSTTPTMLAVDMVIVKLASAVRVNSV